MRHEFELDGEGFRLRPWRRGDEADLVRYANSRKIWINLTNRFPHPYTEKDADGWIGVQERGQGPERAFAIERAGGVIGGIGVSPREDLAAKSAEIGYWLGEPFWGQGIATRALVLLTDWAFRELDIVRIFAHVLDWNPASARVLEKAGYQQEARLRRAIYKDGQIIDGLLYAKVLDP